LLQYLIIHVTICHSCASFCKRLAGFSSLLEKRFAGVIKGVAVLFAYPEVSFLAASFKVGFVYAMIVPGHI
jgi:hypothetical protein